MRLLSAIALLALTSSVAAAQHPQPAGVQLPTPSVRVPSPGAVTGAPLYAFPTRLLLGGAGSLGGAFAGGWAGLTLLNHKPCGCDTEGLDDAVLGAAVGSVVASSVIAAIPQMGSGCSMPQRVGASLLSSLAGAALGGITGSAAGGAGVLYGYLGGAGMGSALGAQLCRG